MTTSLAVMVLSFLPATNLFFYVGFVVAERVLYIPSIGLCLILGHGMTKISSILCRRKMTTICGATLLLACFALQTLKRNQDWKDEESLYKAGIPINPAKGKMGARLERHDPRINLLKANIYQLARRKEGHDSSSFVRANCIFV